MMKFMLIALTLISAPAFADAELCLGGGPVGICIGDGHHGPGWGPGWGPGPRPVQCVAQNGRGQTFPAYGRWPQEAQNNALGYCYQYSRWCRIVWCR